MVLGPLLWNVVYSDLLKQLLSEGVSMVAFADDVALVGVAKDINELEHFRDEAIEVVADRLSHHN